MIDTSDIAIPSEDGSSLYRFDANGLHLATLNTLTGTPIYRFGYDASGYLISVTDADGDITTIERVGAIPTAIIASDHLR